MGPTRIVVLSWGFPVADTVSEELGALDADEELVDDDELADDADEEPAVVEGVLEVEALPQAAAARERATTEAPTHTPRGRHVSPRR